MSAFMNITHDVRILRFYRLNKIKFSLRKLSGENFLGREENFATHFCEQEEVNEGGKSFSFG